MEGVIKMRAFRIGDMVMPKAKGRYSHQRDKGPQKLVKRIHSGTWTWKTDHEVFYSDSDLELVSESTEDPLRTIINEVVSDLGGNSES